MAELKIQVSPTTLRSKASELRNNANNIQSLTEEMSQEINSLRAYWEGSAAETYVSKFEGLRDDFKERYDVINTYAKFLDEAASSFEAAENVNISSGETLIS